jgi:hypothetical protein
VIIRPKDPGAMTREERLHEIAALLARGYFRLASKKSRNCLEAAPTPEAPCAAVVNGKRTRITSEVA